MSYTIVIPKWPNAEEKQRREEIFFMVCSLSSKIQNHVLNCGTFKKKLNSCYDIKCEICSKLLCFLDMVNNEEKRINKEIDIGEKFDVEYMILGEGIKLLE